MFTVSFRHKDPNWRRSSWSILLSRVEEMQRNGNPEKKVNVKASGEWGWQNLSLTIACLGPASGSPLANPNTRPLRASWGHCHHLADFRIGGGRGKPGDLVCYDSIIFPSGPVIPKLSRERLVMRNPWRNHIHSKKEAYVYTSYHFLSTYYVPATFNPHGLGDRYH